MSFLYEHGWMLFVVSEGLTWVLVGLFFFCRYWLRFERVSQWCFVFIVIINVFQIFLGWIDYYFTGEISFFQIVIVLFITYASTLGRSDFQRMDQFIKRKFNINSKRLDQFEGQEGWDRHLPYRFTLFFTHTFAFIMIHYIWFLLEKMTFNNLAEYTSLLASSWFQSIDASFFSLSIYMKTSYFWSIIYLFDLIVFQMYLLIFLSLKLGVLSKN
ncbi:hypothetical protein [Halalkalibacter alkalisediminis]|uniref:Uncharacterized protein n=1 Tax=Halalkalibacter alkalisediminis TaxID=935616 RepID=A0ABV6NDV5_9BACI|nr:hypothetical protein [Halalkalibacter alkalisediminis]